MLRRIPECTNLRFLLVYHCENLEDISELPPTIQKIDARYCFSLTRGTSNMLWSQVSKERSRLAMVMPGKEIPEWFDFIGNGGYPRFWVRGKFPIIAVALIFRNNNDNNVNEIMVSKYGEEEVLELNLVINSLCVPCKGFDRFRIAVNHVLICDLRLLLSSEEEDLDTLFILEHHNQEWNEVQVSYKSAGIFSSLTLTSWGIFVYRGGAQGTNMEDVQFTCPTAMASTSSSAIVNVIPPPPPPHTGSSIGPAMERLMMIISEIQLIQESWNDITEPEQKECIYRRTTELTRESKDLMESLRYYLESKDETRAKFSSVIYIWLDCIRTIDDTANYVATCIPPPASAPPGDDNDMGSTTSDQEHYNSATGLVWRFMLKLVKMVANVFRHFQNKFIN